MRAFSLLFLGVLVYTVAASTPTEVAKQVSSITGLGVRGATASSIL